MAGDLSPLTIEAVNGARRAAPPALVAAIALGLGSVDMPVPSIADWEWLSWKFPRAVHAGDTIYARWTLTQKRPPRGGAPTSIVVWRVDVHTADGTLCAEGEVGATVKRSTVGQRHRTEEPASMASAGAPAATPATGPPAGSRRRKRRPRANGTAIETPAVAAPPAPESKPERAAGSSRRRRRRRPSGSAARDEEHEPRAAHVQDTPAGAPQPAPPPAADQPAPVSGGSQASGTLSRVIRRLRRP